MTALPAAGYFSNPARTNAEAKQAQDDTLAAIRELLGGSAETTLTINAGSITPVSACHAIDTEAAAATDDLTNILTTNQPDGRMLLIRAVNAAHKVVVKHNAGGAGQAALSDSADFTLDTTDKWLLLKRAGVDWTEVLRSSGSDHQAKLAFNRVMGHGRLAKSAAYTVVAADRGKLIPCDASGAGFTLGVTAAATLGDGFIFGVLKTDSSANGVTVDPNAAETINGAATRVLGKQWQEEWYRCNGAGFEVIGIARDDLRLQGRETINAVAGLWQPRADNGCDVVLRTAAATVGRPDVWGLGFSASVQQYAQTGFTPPDCYDGGTLLFQFDWTQLVAGSGGVAFGLRAAFEADGDAIDTAYGTAVYVTDTSLGTLKKHLSPLSAAVTPAGAWAKGKRIEMQIDRDPANAGDTLGVKAYLREVRLFFNTNAGNDN